MKNKKTKNIYVNEESIFMSEHRLRLVFTLFFRNYILLRKNNVPVYNSIR